jgi:hypothetical protein
MLLLVLAVAATGCGGKSSDSGTGSSVSTDDSGTGSSVSTSERSDGGGDTTAKRTPSLQSAFDTARYYLDTESLSRRALLQRMAMNGFETYSEAEAEAVEDAKNREPHTPRSPKRLMLHLTLADGFSKAEATYAVSHAGRDWNAEAVMAAKSALDADAHSKSQLIKKLKLKGFTDAQVRYAVEKVY